MIDIRPASLRDLSVILGIESRVDCHPWSEDLIHSHLSSAHNLSFVLTAKGCTLAYVLAEHILSEIHLYKIGVLKKFQRQKFGSLLLAHLLQYAHTSHIQAVYLEVRKANVSAIAFYKKFKFKETGLRKNYYLKPSDHAVLMTYLPNTEK